MRDRIEMKAVYDQDLEQILASLGILDKLIAGELSCVICGCQVDLDNLGAIFSDGSEIRVCCDNDRCVRATTTYGVPTVSE